MLSTREQGGRVCECFFFFSVEQDVGICCAPSQRDRENKKSAGVGCHIPATVEAVSP